MIYLDVRRPSDHLPTVELRICDACPRLDDVVLLAGLFRALVIRETGAALAGRPPPAVRPELLYGLEGNLVGPVTATPVPAHQLIGQLLSELRPALDAAGDRELGARLAEPALARGSSAARQRAAYARGGLQKVADILLAETRAGTAGCRAREPLARRSARCRRATPPRREAVRFDHSARGPFRMILPQTRGWPWAGISRWEPRQTG